MAMFKKRAAALLLACAVLTGCGAGSSVPEADSAPESSASDSPADSEAESSSAEETATAKREESSAAETEQTSAKDESSKPDDTSASDSAADGTTSAPDSTAPQSTAPSSTTASTTKTTAGTKESSSAQTTSTEAKHQNLSGFGAKWPDLFTDGGAPIIKADSYPYSYQSEDINIQINQQKYGETVYYIADIHIRYIDNFRSAFSINRATGVEDFWDGDDDPYTSSNFQEDGAKLSARVNSILTINGDYYSGRKDRIVFRNGQLYRNIPRAEVGAIYRDGTYKGFTMADFNVQSEQDKGLWQVMGFEPRLVENGKAIPNISDHLYGDSGYKERMVAAAPRSGFGYYEPGHYCFVVADGRQEGWSVGPELQEWADFFETLGCEGAFNLDGGASSQMYFMGNLINKPTTGTSGGVIRQLPDVFYIGEIRQ